MQFSSKTKHVAGYLFALIVFFAPLQVLAQSYETYLDGLLSAGDITQEEFSNAVRDRNVFVPNGLSESQWNALTPEQRATAMQRSQAQSQVSVVERQRQALAGSGCTWYNWPAKMSECVWSKVLGLIGGTFLFLGGSLLHWAGVIFNMLVTHVIIQFGATIQTLQLIEGIHNAWTVLRDISNIVIIGMFTFIAISIIIGNHTFGEKKLVAKVLVIAVLINFSLLFAKIIIDSSNFFSFQIYRAMGSPADAGGANISGKFLATTGITNLFSGEAWTTSIQKGETAARANSQSSDSTTLSALGGSLQALFHGLVGGALLLFAAGVLLYGSYLIIARAVLLIFLMLVSALAFATYLIPQLSGGEYGWSTWWKSLINAAIFGPLLMLLLYVSLVVISRMPNSQNSGSDGSWIPILTLAIGIGMLYVSFKVANSFAGKIAGFSTASMLTGIPVVGTARFAGLVGRSFPGRWSAYKHAELSKKPNKTFADQLALRALNWGKKSTFDPSKPKILAGALDKLHAPKFGSDWGKGGYSGVKKRQTDHAVHVAAENSEKPAAAADRAEKEKREEMAEKIRGEIAKNTREVGKSREQAKEVAKISSDDQRVLAQEVKRAAQEAGRRAPSSDEINREATAQHARSEDRERVNGEMATKIGRAQETATAKAVEQTLGTDIESLKEQLHALEHGDLKSLPPHLKKEIEQVRKDAHDAAHHAEEAFAKSVASFAPGMLLGDRNAVKGVRDALKSHDKKAKIREQLTEWKALETENAGAAHGAAHATPAPKAAAPTGHAAPAPAAKGDDHGHH